MKWRREESGNISKSEKGYLVTASRIGDGWTYTAWGPNDLSWRDRLKVTYQVGEQIPQPRELLGSYRDPIDAAKACTNHWEKSKSVSSRAA